MRFRDRWKNVNNCVYTGTVFDGNTKMEPSSYFLDKFIAKEDCADYLNRANGFWGAVVTDGCSKGWMAADRIRSYPLFYAQKDGILYISDDAYWIREECQLEEIDKDAEQELLMTEQVTGSDTLFRGIKQVQAGEIVFFKLLNDENIWLITAKRYYVYLHEIPYKCSRKELLELQDNAMLNTFSRLCDYANGRTIVVPLSGGYDSRLIVLTLKKLLYPNIIAFSYGVKGNMEATISQEVAKQLNIPWYFVEYTVQSRKSSYYSNIMREYERYAGNFVSLPHIQDWEAVKEFKVKSTIPSDSIFVAGYSSEVPAGSRSLKYPELYTTKSSSEDAIVALENFIYRLSTICNNAQVKENNKKRIMNRIGNLKQHINPASIFESFDISERQAKFINNAIRAYEFWGYNWWTPYWDIEFLDFWSKVPLQLHVNQDLYLEYLVQESKRHGLFKGEELKRDSISKKNQNINKIKECLEKKLPKCIYSKLLALGGKNKTQMMSALRNEDFSYAIKKGAKSSNGVLCALYIKKVMELIKTY